MPKFIWLEGYYINLEFVSLVELKQDGNRVNVIIDIANSSENGKDRLIKTFSSLESATIWCHQIFGGFCVNPPCQPRNLSPLKLPSSPDTPSSPEIDQDDIRLFVKTVSPTPPPPPPWSPNSLSPIPEVKGALSPLSYTLKTMIGKDVKEIKTRKTNDESDIQRKSSNESVVRQGISESAVKLCQRRTRSKRRPHPPSVSQVRSRSVGLNHRSVGLNHRSVSHPKKVPSGTRPRTKRKP